MMLKAIYLIFLGLASGCINDPVAAEYPQPCTGSSKTCRTAEILRRFAVIIHGFPAVYNPFFQASRKEFPVSRGMTVADVQSR